MLASAKPKRSDREPSIVQHCGNKTRGKKKQIKKKKKKKASSKPIAKHRCACRVAVAVTTGRLSLRISFVSYSVRAVSSLVGLCMVNYSNLKQAYYSHGHSSYQREERRTPRRPLAILLPNFNLF
jgi:hypothetical protein